MWLGERVEKKPFTILSDRSIYGFIDIFKSEKSVSNQNVIQTNNGKKTEGSEQTGLHKQ